MKIGILTFHNAMNYGAILQCYALQCYIKETFKCEVVVINYTPEYFRRVFYDPLKPLQAYGLKNKVKALVKDVIRHEEMKMLSVKNKKLTNFIDKNLNLENPVSNLDESDIDIFLAGSDQIWNLELLSNDITYLLGFVKGKRKVSYAASFKVSDIDEFAIMAYKKYLPQFSAVSVRETNLQKYLQENIGVTSECVLDPTLLVDNKFWEKICKKNNLINKKYLLLYYVNLPDSLVCKAFKYAKDKELEVVSLNKLRGQIGYRDFSNASIEEFLSLISNAEVVFTTSFHGMVFSIIFEKEFYFEVPPNSYNNNARLLDLAQKLGLEERNVALNNTEHCIQWEEVKIKLKQNRKISEEFLYSALEGVEKND